MSEYPVDLLTFTNKNPEWSSTLKQFVDLWGWRLKG